MEDTGWVVKSSYTLGILQLDDIDIYQKAKEHGKVILVSKDNDFPALIDRLGAPPKLIFLKVENCDNQVLWNFIKHRIHEAVAVLVNDDVDIVELD